MKKRKKGERIEGQRGSVLIIETLALGLDPLGHAAYLGDGGLVLVEDCAAGAGAVGTSLGLVVEEVAVLVVGAVRVVGARDSFETVPDYPPPQLLEVVGSGIGRACKHRRSDTLWCKGAFASIGH